MPDEQTPTATAETADSTTPATTALASPEAAPTSAPAEDSSSEAGDWFSALDNAFKESEEAEPAEKAEPAKQDAKKEDKSDAAEDAETKNMTPTAGAKFKEIKAEAKAAKSRVAELEARLAEVEKGGAKPDPVEAERVQQLIAEKEAKLAEYEQELEATRALYSVERTKEYRDAVIQPMAAILSVVERLAKKYDIPEKALISVLEESDPDVQGDRISEVGSNFTERDRVSLYALGDDYAAVLASRDEIRSRSVEALKAREKMAQEENARAASEAEKRWKSASSSVWQKMRDKIPLPDDERSSIEAEVTKQIGNLQFNDLSDEIKAFAAYSGALVPHVVKANKALQSKVSELEQALQKYQQATPGAGAGAATPVGEVDESLPFLDAIERRFGN